MDQWSIKIMLGEGQLPEQKQTFSAGANFDTSPEKLFNNANTGIFIDGHNVQPTSNDGNTGDLEKIKGQQILYENTIDDSTYECMLADTVSGKLFELWAPNTPSKPTIGRVDGVVMLSTTLLDLRPEYPLQWDVNDSEVDSVISFTERRPGVPPYIFSVNDIYDSYMSGSSKYFSSFNPEDYQINIQSVLDRPVFVEMVNVGGGGGKPVGQYQYQMRYVSQSGDFTQWSHPTPLIQVGQILSSDSLIYPYSRTSGGMPDPESKTSFAPKIRFRVTNLYNYDYIEIKCIPYNAGAGLGYTSNGNIVARIDVNFGEISVREYIDPQDSNIDIPLSAQDEKNKKISILCS